MNNNGTSDENTSRRFVENLARTIRAMIVTSPVPSLAQYKDFQPKSRFNAISKLSGVTLTTAHNYASALFDDAGNCVIGPKNIETIAKLGKPFGLSLAQIIYIAETAQDDNDISVMLLRFITGDHRLKATMDDDARSLSA